MESLGRRAKSGRGSYRYQAVPPCEKRCKKECDELSIANYLFPYCPREPNRHIAIPVCRYAPAGAEGAWGSVISHAPREKNRCKQKKEKVGKSPCRASAPASGRDAAVRACQTHVVCSRARLAIDSHRPAAFFSCIRDALAALAQFSAHDQAFGHGC